MPSAIALGLGVRATGTPSSDAIEKVASWSLLLVPRWGRFYGEPRRPGPGTPWPLPIVAVDGCGLEAALRFFELGLERCRSFGLGACQRRGVGRWEGVLADAQHEDLGQRTARHQLEIAAGDELRRQGTRHERHRALLEHPDAPDGPQVIAEVAEVDGLHVDTLARPPSIRLAATRLGWARGTGREVEQLEPDGFVPRRDQDGEGRVWAAYMHTTTVTAVGNKVVSGLTLYCTGGDKLTFGTTASADLGSSCGVQGSYMMQGFNTFSGIYVDSLGPRCDPMFDITKADWYGLQRGGTGGTSGSLLCDEGEYMAGAKVYRVNTANGYVFNGISLMCREPQ